MMSDATLDQDFELVRRTREGDESAFTELMTRHKEKAIQLAYCKMGNWEDAKDVAQEAFVKAYRALSRFEGKAKFSTWLYRIVMTTAYDAWRAKKWRRFLIFKKQQDMDLFFENKASSVNAHSELVDGENDAWLSASIRALPEKQRIIFTLRYADDHSLNEIAEITDVSLGTVKATLHSAVHKIKADYEKRKDKS